MKSAYATLLAMVLSACSGTATLATPSGPPHCDWSFAEINVAINLQPFDLGSDERNAVRTELRDLIENDLGAAGITFTDSERARLYANYMAIVDPESGLLAVEGELKVLADGAVGSHRVSFVCWHTTAAAFVTKEEMMPVLGELTREMTSRMLESHDAGTPR